MSGVLHGSSSSQFTVSTVYSILRRERPVLLDELLCGCPPQTDTYIDLGTLDLQVQAVDQADSRSREDQPGQDPVQGVVRLGSQQDVEVGDRQVEDHEQCR